MEAKNVTIYVCEGGPLSVYTVYTNIHIYTFMYVYMITVLYTIYQKLIY